MLRTTDLYTASMPDDIDNIQSRQNTTILLLVEFGMGGRFENDTAVDDVSCYCSRKPILLLRSVPPPPPPTPHVDDKIRELVESSLGRGERR